MQVRVHEQPLKKSPSQAPRQLRRIKLDTYAGMAVSNGVAFFIMLTAAATLHAHGDSNIQTAAQAATALEPLAGRFAYALFSVGIIVTGLLAVPVLAGAAAYAVGEAMHWRVGLEAKPAPSDKILCHVRNGHAGWFAAELRALRSDQVSFHRRSHQRSAGCAGDGVNDADDAQPKNHGLFSVADLPAGDGLGGNDQRCLWLRWRFYSAARNKVAAE